MIIIFEPVIKWSGSKRSQAENILKYFPKEMNTYYEPFCGGSSLLRRLLESGIKVNHYICSDLNMDLINLWNVIKNNPEKLSKHYSLLWKELNKDDDKQRKKEYFTQVRERFNNEKNPFDFMFIMRTCVNGMPRYNKNGKFNTSFHITRNGIEPDTLKKIICEWSELLNDHNVEFICCSYENIKPKERDFMYLDPPYANTRGMYYGAIEYEKLWNWLRGLSCRYALSFDGVSGEINCTYAVPEDVYVNHEYLINGNSSFKRTTGKSNVSIVYESLYTK